MLRLRLDEENAFEDEVRLARIAILAAMLAALGTSNRNETVDVVRRRHDLQLGRANAALETGLDNGPAARDRAGEDANIVRAAIAAERRRLSALHCRKAASAMPPSRRGELDLRELNLQPLLSSQPSAR
jgi:hypothetical protein